MMVLELLHNTLPGAARYLCFCKVEAIGALGILGTVVLAEDQSKQRYYAWTGAIKQLRELSISIRALQGIIQ